VGHKNLFDGAITTDASGAIFTTGTVSMRVAPAPVGPAMVSVPVHRLQITRDPVALANRYEASVSSIAYLGPFMQIAVKIGPLTLEAHQPSTVAMEALQVGMKVHAGWDRDDAILIPAG
jgi:hypothetical protein